MKQILAHEFGGPEVLRLCDVAEPEPPDDGYLVEVNAAGVNFADVVERRGQYRAEPRLPVASGREAAGRIVARGRHATELAVGDRALVLKFSGGCYAERVAVGPREVLPTRLDLGDDELAGYPATFSTAWYVLHELLRVRPDESVLIHAAAGGVGSAAVQLARALGCRPVLGTAGGADKCRWVEELGADHCIDYRAGDFRTALAERTGGTVDAVLDSVSGEILAQSLAVLAPLGRLAVVGFSSVERDHASALRRIHPLTLLHRSICVAGVDIDALDVGARRASWDRMDRFVAEHGLRPRIGASYPLAEAARAHRDLEQRRSRGKLVLRP